jgi:hypothetical protein
MVKADIEDARGNFPQSESFANGEYGHKSGRLCSMPEMQLGD